MDCYYSAATLLINEGINNIEAVMIRLIVRSVLLAGTTLSGVMR
ncbi:hypothetical protein [Alkaliphilus metalliredigens]|nr:hypothetical protein [Alkaliphilus metalliredigens]